MEFVKSTLYIKYTSTKQNGVVLFKPHLPHGIIPAILYSYSSNGQKVFFNLINKTTTERHHKEQVDEEQRARKKNKTRENREKRKKQKIAKKERETE